LQTSCNRSRRWRRLTHREIAATLAGLSSIERYADVIVFSSSA
jgi:hypothetical protein